MVLATCNRTEIYVGVPLHGALADATEALSDLAGLSTTTIQSRCAVYFDEGAVAHTFAVAAGLDSVVIESQILGQVKNALTTAQSNGTVGTALNALFQQALRVGKRVQAETWIGSAGRSWSASRTGCSPTSAARWPASGCWSSARSMAGLAARTAAASGAEVTCVNRTLARAQLLADAVGGRAVPLTELGTALTRADVLVTCTGART